ncbi:zinc metallopeptidase [uncultured Enterovirga sp.]|uniref:zinc metallopeptidase n=1 Tax=uncultured Enterovirga sp. TaxID=2026352 RepID=UPI0035CB3AB9
MVVLVALAVVALAVLILGPQMWVHRTLAAHAGDRTDLPGTGAELARHLLDLGGLTDVPVERVAKGADHYDPQARRVCLGPEAHDTRSVTGIAVAAHEAGHAFQHADGDRLLAWRIALAPVVRGIEIVAAVVLSLAPLTFALVKSPVAVGLQIGLAVLLMTSRVVVHLLTLPVELDASFGRALPILERGGYLAGPDLTAARSVLRAAAMTYVASALATLLNVVRWFRL